MKIEKKRNNEINKVKNLIETTMSIFEGKGSGREKITNELFHR